MDNPIIYPTSLNKLSACRLQYHWSRKYKSLYVAPQLSFGIAMHETLAAYYNAGFSTDIFFADFAKKNNLDESQTSLGNTVWENYLTEYHEKDQKRFRVVAIEKELIYQVPLPKDSGISFTNINVGARIDGIVFDRQLHNYFVLEHKTFDKFYASSLESDHQFIIEKFVAEQFLGKRISGVIYNGIRKTRTISRTTKLFERHTIYINKTQTERALYRVFWTMQNALSSDFKIFPEPSGLKCSQCEFRMPCNSYMRGEDYKFILANSYSRKPKEEKA